MATPLPFRFRGNCAVAPFFPHSGFHGRGHCAQLTSRDPTVYPAGAREPQEDDMAYKRKSMSRKSSRKNFRKGARVKGKNLRSRPMRGGWRL